ncbi:MAG: hypothetical protein QXH67_05350 [Candidatus Bathyarchaeia archaeon]
MVRPSIYMLSSSRNPRSLSSHIFSACPGYLRVFSHIPQPSWSLIGF